MKMTAAILIFLFTLSCTHMPPRLTKPEKIIVAANTALVFVDYRQTLHIAKHTNEFYELNPVLGEYPDEGEVTRYMICWAALQIAAIYLCPPKYRTYLGIAMVSVNAHNIYRNNMEGVRIE